MITYLDTIKNNWKNAWRNRIFKSDLILGMIALAVLAIFTYFFFDYIENRPGGLVMNDWVLKFLPAEDVSVPIVFFELSVIILFLVRAVKDPSMVITFLIAYVFILLTRSITIGITQLRPPIGLIALKDPVADLIYRSKISNRDLFYSGHTSLLFLIYLCSNNKPVKYFMLFATMAVGVLLLIQHVHYTIDVVCAPFFAYSCYWIAKKITHIPQRVAFVRM
jgi:membrane-associated phospholipid phosphatase